MPHETRAITATSPSVATLNSTDASRAANSQSPDQPPPYRHRPEIQRRMHVGGAQVAGDVGKAGWRPAAPAHRQP